MKSKDLFNAINDIDEKFITDAGKYLKNDEDLVSSHYADPIEVHPSAGKFSPMKLIAPIAAAAVLICSITIALKTRVLYPSQSADMIVEDSEDNQIVGAAASDTAPDGETEWTSINTDGLLDKSQSPTATQPILDENGELHGALPFTLYGPDNLQISYDEITDIFQYVSKKYLNDSNWVEITCDGFAYIADPQGVNYNIIDDPEKFNGDEIAYPIGERTFNRVYEGGQYNGFTVKRAYSKFWRMPTNGMTEQQMKEHNLPLSLLYQGSWLELEGSIETDVYIVKNSDDQYICVLRNREIPIPTMNINVQDDGSFGSYLYCDSEFGFEFKTEVPSILLSLTADEKRQLDNLFANKTYQKAHVALSDMTISYDAAEQDPYQVTASVKVTDIQLDDSNIEPSDVSSLIRRSLTVEELEKDIISKYSTISEVHAYYDIEDIYGDVIIGLEQTEGELQPEMTVALYDRNGLVGIYTYQQK